jgi:hypothetical protein
VQLYSQQERDVTSSAVQMWMPLHMPATLQLAALLLLLLLAAALTAVVLLSLRVKVPLLLLLRQHRGSGSPQPCRLCEAGWTELLCCLLALLRRVPQVRYIPQTAHVTI